MSTIARWVRQHAEAAKRDDRRHPVTVTIAATGERFQVSR